MLKQSIQFSESELDDLILRFTLAAVTADYSQYTCETTGQKHPSSRQRFLNVVDALRSLHRHDLEVPPGIAAGRIGEILPGDPKAEPA